MGIAIFLNAPLGNLSRNVAAAGEDELRSGEEMLPEMSCQSGGESLSETPWKIGPEEDAEAKATATGEFEDLEDEIIRKR